MGIICAYLWNSTFKKSAYVLPLKKSLTYLFLTITAKKYFAMKMHQHMHCAS